MTRAEFDRMIGLVCTALKLNPDMTSEAMRARIELMDFDQVRAFIEDERPGPPIVRLVQGLARTIEPKLPADYGFILMVFQFGDGGRVNYVANAERADCINVLKEFLIHNGAAEDWMKHV